MNEKTNQQQEVFETKTSKIWKHDEHILIAEPKSKAIVELEDAIGHMEIIAKITNSEKWAMLIDMRQLTSMSKEARTYYAEGNAKGRVAIALLIGSYFSKILANFYIAHSKPKYPIQLFTSKEKAIAWLKEHLK